MTAASPYAYTPKATRMRRRKAEQIVIAARELGYTSLPLEDVDALRLIRRRAGLPRDPSSLTWTMAAMLLDGDAPDTETSSELVPALDSAPPSATPTSSQLADVDDDVEPDR